MTNKKIPVIIDCDPGVDDILAILLALKSPELDVLGMTTVCGNSTVENTSWNATCACRLADTDSALVYPGADAPLQRPFHHDSSFSGEQGLCEVDVSGNRTLISDKTAYTFLKETLQSAKDPVTIVSIAAMTNIAQVLRDMPELGKNIKEIVTISGYYWLNPFPARAEWNILCDPEAAKHILESKIPIRALGLDVTCQLKNGYIPPLVQNCSGMMRKFMEQSIAYLEAHHLDIGGMLVDAMAVAAVILPAIGCYQRGQTLVNPQCADQHLTEFSIGEGNVMAAETFDFPLFLELLESRVMK